MLYDPKWEVQDKQLGPISLKAFIGWLETKDPAEPYNYCDAANCALGQFRSFEGHADPIVNVGHSRHDADWQQALERIVHPENHKDWTFGGALKRARAELARR